MGFQNMQTLDWIKSMEHPGGGIRAWPGYNAYPEVTGYLLPTLQNYGENDLILRCTEWLERTQNPDGSWNGLDGVPRTFDTAAIVEGLEAVGRWSAAGEARAWLDIQILSDGTLKPSYESNRFEAYNLRALAIMGRIFGDMPLPSGRSHYIAYAMEGLWRSSSKNHDGVRLALSGISCPVLWDWNEGGNVDYCATAQFGVLKAWAGMDYMPYLEYMRSAMLPDGSFPMGFSWTAKFYLDLEYEHKLRN